MKTTPIQAARAKKRHEKGGDIGGMGMGDEQSVIKKRRKRFGM
jgi:hypothetical protein